MIYKYLVPYNFPRGRQWRASNSRYPHGEDEDALHQSEQGLVVTDTHLGDFDDFPITWYRILPRSLLEF